jgi:SAM-dependent methyltransferase
MNEREYELMYEVESGYWWYRGMRSVALGFAPSLFERRDTGRHLDAGCGTGANLEHVLARSRASGHGVDLSLEALRFSRRRGHGRLAQASIEALPFRDRTFDTAATHDVLGCLPADARALSELFRVLEPNGLLLVAVAAFEALRGEHDRATHLARRLTVPEVVASLERAGFRVERTSYANCLLSIPIYLVRVVRRRFFAARAQAEATSDFHLAPGALDGLLRRVLEAEAWVLRKGGRLPFGVTALVLARKPG